MSGSSSSSHAAAGSSQQPFNDTRRSGSEAGTSSSVGPQSQSMTRSDTSTSIQSQQYVHARSYSTASASSSLSVPGASNQSSESHPPRTGSPESSRTTRYNHKHSRTTSSEYRETLDAVSKDLEDGSRIINQYKMLNEIGRGAYGTVHRGVLVADESVEFAIKEFGKTRMRKNHRAANLRKPLFRGRGRGRGGARGRGGFSARGVGPDGNAMKEANELVDKQQESRSTDHQGENDDNGDRSRNQGTDEFSDPLYLVRHELAILKKLNHPHVVKLYEVLDDPAKDSLYMVFEYCPDGVVIDIQMHRSTKPLDEEIARGYFRQILLGVEYLHNNDIVHRDLKPDNILLTDDRKTCKIVDFGVSEMFLKPGDDTLHKSAGSPAFMSPELCTAGHGDFHGKKDDIWSLGVTLYCMVVGRVPFDQDQFLALYESIKADEPAHPSHLSSGVSSLLKRMLCKDPDHRADVAEMREHPWVTKNGTEPLISVDENLEDVVTAVTEEELDTAVGKITSIFTIARVISRFKRAGSRSRAASQCSSDSTSTGPVTRLAHAAGVSSPPPLGRLVTGGAAGLAGAVAGLVDRPPDAREGHIGGIEGIDKMDAEGNRADRVESPVDMDDSTPSGSGGLKSWHGSFGSDSILSPVIEVQPSPIVEEDSTRLTKDADENDGSSRVEAEDSQTPTETPSPSSEDKTSSSPTASHPAPPANRRMDSLLSIGSFDSRAGSSSMDGGELMSRSASGRGGESNTSFESGDESEGNDSQAEGRDEKAEPVAFVDSPAGSDDDQGPDGAGPSARPYFTGGGDKGVTKRTGEQSDNSPKSPTSLLAQLHLAGSRDEDHALSRHHRHHPSFKTIEEHARKAGVRVSEAIMAFAEPRLAGEREIYEQAKQRVRGVKMDAARVERPGQQEEGQPPKKAAELEGAKAQKQAVQEEAQPGPNNDTETQESKETKPRLLDAPIVQSPVNEGLPTPPLASKLYQGFADIGYYD